MEPEFDERVREIADQVKLAVTRSHDLLGVSVNTGEKRKYLSSVNFKIDEANFQVGGNVYENNLPDGITLETIKELEKYNSDFEAGALLGIGESSLEQIKQNSDLTFLNTSINSEPGKKIIVFIGIGDKAEALFECSKYSFGSHTRGRCNSISNEEKKLTQQQIVRKHLDELYKQALCETMTDNTKLAPIVINF